MRSATKIRIVRLTFVTIVVICLVNSRSPSDEDAPSYHHHQPASSYKEEGYSSSLPLGSEAWCPPTSEKSPTKDLLPLEDLSRFESEWRNASYNIFLQESSCNTRPSYRVWCAVESLANQNPGARVWYLMTSPTANGRDGLLPLLTLKYKNLRVVTVDLKRIFSETPLERIYETGVWKNNNTWPEINLADIMRLAVVWKLGGLYADSDFVCIRPLTKLNNMIAWQEGFTLGSGVFHFTRRHPVMKLVLEYVEKNFQPEKWGSSGPMVFTKIMKELCDVKDKKKEKKCMGVSLLPIRSFYPITSVIWRTLFMAQAPRDVRKRYPSSYMIHCWNQLSYDEPIVKDSGSIYDEAASSFCPVSRKVATTNTLLY